MPHPPPTTTTTLLPTTTTKPSPIDAHQRRPAKLFASYDGNTSTCRRPPSRPASRPKVLVASVPVPLCFRRHPPVRVPPRSPRRLLTTARSTLRRAGGQHQRSVSSGDSRISSRSRRRQISLCSHEQTTLLSTYTNKPYLRSKSSATLQEGLVIEAQAGKRASKFSSLSA